MCLMRTKRVRGKMKSGIGYKIVQTTDKEDEFTPYWDVFRKDGNGGTYESHMDSELLYEKEKVTYRIGEWTEVKHKNKAAISIFPYKKYIAYIHLYKSETDILPTPGYAVVKCEYEGATYHDDDTIVAKRIKPIKIME